MNNRVTIWLRRIGVTIGSILCLGAIIFGIKWVLQVFTIQEIIVSGDPAIVEINKKSFVGNILFFQTAAIADKIIEDNPLVRSVLFKKKYPHTIEIVVYKRIPVALLVTPKVSIGIDEHGTIIGDIQNQDAPQLIFDIPIVRIGKTIEDESVKLALQFLEGTKTFLSVKKIKKFDVASLQVDSVETNIIFTQKQDMRATLDTLQTLITGFRIKGSMPKTVDLRFGKPIVQF